MRLHQIARAAGGIPNSRFSSSVCAPSRGDGRINARFASEKRIGVRGEGIRPLIEPVLGETMSLEILDDDIRAVD